MCRRINFEDSSPRIKNIFNKCKEYSQKSQMKNKHCASFVKNGKIVEMAVNDYYGWNRLSKFSVHAEERLIENALKCKTRKRFDIFIVRVSEKNDHYLNSEPCSECTKLIKQYKHLIRNVYYTYDNESYIIEKPHNLVGDHISIGYKKVN